MTDTRVYTDESGIHDDASWLVLSGWIAQADDWLAFEQAWDKVLEKFDVADFHATDFFSFAPGGERVGRYRRYSNPDEVACYEDWSVDDSIWFLRRLVSAISTASLAQVGAALDVEAFRELPPGLRKALTGAGIKRRPDGTYKWLSTGAPNKPYFFLFGHVLAAAAQRVPRGEKILFVFDQQKVYEGGAQSQFNTFVGAQGVVPEIRESLGGITFQKRQEAGALQAADLWAHCWYRWLTEGPGAVGSARQEAINFFVRAGYESIPQLDASEIQRLLSPAFTDPTAYAWARQWRPDRKKKRSGRRVVPKNPTE